MVNKATVLALKYCAQARHSPILFIFRKPYITVMRAVFAKINRNRAVKDQLLYNQRIIALSQFKNIFLIELTPSLLVFQNQQLQGSKNIITMYFLLIQICVPIVRVCSITVIEKFLSELPAIGPN